MNIRIVPCTPEPDACPGIEALQPDDGQTLACPTVPGNAD